MKQIEDPLRRIVDQTAYCQQAIPQTAFGRLIDQWLWLSLLSTANRALCCSHICPLSEFHPLCLHSDDHLRTEKAEVLCAAALARDMDSRFWSFSSFCSSFELP